MANSVGCSIHFVDVCVKKQGLRSFSDKTLSTARDKAAAWIQLDCPESGIAKNFLNLLSSKSVEVEDTLFYHAHCYSKFTLESRIDAAKKRTPEVSDNLEDAQSRAPGKESSLRSSSFTKSAPRKKKCLFPELCIICGKQCKWIRGKQGVRVRDKLVLCQTDGTTLMNAALRHNAEHVLRHLRVEDPAASEVKYHKSCYRQFTKDPEARESSSTVSVDKMKNASNINIVFETFCDTVLIPRIIEGEEVLSLSYLHSLFCDIFKDVTTVLPSVWFQTADLKKMIKERFPAISFSFPNGQRNKSQLVFLSTSALPIQSDFITTVDTSASEEDLSESEFSDQHQTTNTQSEGIDMHNILSTLYKGALALKVVLKTFPRQKTTWPPTAEDCKPDALKQQVPVLLFNFLAWACDKTDDDVTTEPVSLRTNKTDCEQKICSLAHDLLALATREVTTKQLMLSLATRHITGSKRVVEILNGLGHGASYSIVVEHDTALAEMENSGHGIPSGFEKGVPSVLVWDNNDFREETLSGKGTTHCTTGIIIQRSQQHGQVNQEVQSESVLRTKRTYKKSLAAPETDIIPFTERRKQQPLIVVEDPPSELCDTQADIFVSLDLAYYVCQVTAANRQTSVPGWSGFNSLINPPSQLSVSKIGYLPIIDANPTEMNTVNTILHKSVRIADKLELQSVVVVMDQSLYAKAQEIRWINENLKQRLVLRLGEFHTTMCFMSVIGKRFKDAELEDIIIESGLVAPGSVTSVMSGHHYNRSVRVHMVVAEALSRLRWEDFLDSLEGHRTRVEELAAGLLDAFVMDPTEFQNAAVQEDIQAVLAEYIKVINTRSAQNPTYHFWSSYISMVCLLQQFIRATRTGNWDLHLVTLRQMIPYYFAYDRINYARFTPCYLSEMENMCRTHPVTYTQMKQGDFAVQRQPNSTFSQTACDQVIEQTINKHSKTQGGLIGKTVKKGAVHRWILSSHIRGEITTLCENVARASSSVSKAHTKSLYPASVKAHQKQVMDVITTVQNMINPFGQSDKRIINISSGVIPDEQVEMDLMNAHDSGLRAYEVFKKERLHSKEKSIYAPMKTLKLKSFSHQGKLVTTCLRANEHVTFKASKCLLRRMLHLGKLDKCNVKETLTYPLVPIPPCFGHYDGSIMKTNKAKLLQVLDDIVLVDPSTLPLPTAIIIDGMAAIHAVSVSNMHTFSELSEKLLSNIINEAQQRGATRVDFVLDTYQSISIKNSERKRRAASGVSTIKVVKGSQQLPKQWKKYLASEENKTHLFEYLCLTWCHQSIQSVELYIAHGRDCHLIRDVDGDISVMLVPDLISDHEEADTRLLLHALHASRSHK